MLKAVGLFGRKKSGSSGGNRHFKDFYADWFNTLNTTLLPSLQNSMSESDSSLTHLSTQVETLHRHFQSYYDALDLAAANDVAQLLYPDWRNPLEKPFLFLGDLHPYLFTNLLRFFLKQNDSEDDEEYDNDSLTVQFADAQDRDRDQLEVLFDRPWHIATAWRSPSYDLMGKLEQVERGLRLMVPALVARARDAQAGFLEHVGRNWDYGSGLQKAAVAEAMAEQNEEMVGVFVDANRLRRSVLVEILGATSVFQAALFLEGLAQFLVGFRDPELLAQFDLCKTPLGKQNRLAI
ncbi:protein INAPERTURATE POLLEN1 [Pyrus x bretschneideri]|uniref:protein INAPERTURATE POLLEN1 n=1 Tax=Pyrus x bretschneideri TaxID=225117 RepID=UPI00202E3A32|nr:protein INAPERTURATE POLLEN1 [Pyrus x bretschneideri]